MTPSPAPPDGLQRAPLDIYKKIAVVRSADDTVSYEDSQGRQQTISGLGNEAISANPSLQPKIKLDIPVPRISDVETYNKDVSATYEIPRSYVRYSRASAEEIQNTIEYNLDLEDEIWLNNHPRFGTFVNERKNKVSKEENNEKNELKLNLNGGKDAESDENTSKSKKKGNQASFKTDSTTMWEDVIVEGNESMDEFDSQDEEDGKDPYNMNLRPTLSLSAFEHMIDILEKATEFETIITLSQAERLILAKIPTLLQTFKTSGAGGPTIKCDRNRKKNPPNVRTVISDVYNYWIQKRSKLKKPLLRKYWPVTASNDTNPHLVFRPREKEKYKLRKKRQNDYDAYNKMKQLRIDFAKVRMLLELVQRREEINRTLLDMQCDWFDQRVYDMIDTSALPKESDRLCKSEIETLLDIPKHIDTQSLDRGKKRKRSKKINSSKNVARASPVVTQASAESEAVPSEKPIPNETKPSPATKVIADQEHAPLFLHPLETRESYVTSWDNAVPFVTSYVDSHPTPTFRFRHRPRIGRGGRVVIDRLPRPGNPNCPPINIFTAGDESSLRRASEPKSGLLDLLPEKLDHQKLSRRIEEIAASALSDEEESNIENKGYITVGTANNDTNGAEEDEVEDVLVKLNDWMETDEQLWGEELCAIGPV